MPLSSAPGAGDAGRRYPTQTNVSSPRQGGFVSAHAGLAPLPAPPPAPSFNWTSFSTRWKNTHGALFQLVGREPQLKEVIQHPPAGGSRKALTWKAALTTLIPLNNVHFHIHQKMVKRQDGGLFTI